MRILIHLKDAKVSVFEISDKGEADIREDGHLVVMDYGRRKLPNQPGVLVAAYAPGEWLSVASTIDPDHVVEVAA